jgi:hypothetical protein
LRNVILVFARPAGRDEDVGLVLISAKCSPGDAQKDSQACAAGTNLSCCSHIHSALTLLVWLQQGSIGAGECGDGEKAWGGQKKKSSAVPCQSTGDVALLTPGGSLLREFTGVQEGKVKTWSPVMAEYIKRFQQLAGPETPATIVELHNCKTTPPTIIRQGAKILREKRNITPPPSPKKKKKKKKKNSTKK